ncbi:MAG: hypothetical protein ACJ8FS_01350 [Sphingomicrobium sp.]
MTDEVLAQITRQQARRSARLVGATNQSRLRWLVKFAGTDNFETMSRSAFHRWQRALAAFAELSARSYQNPENLLSPAAAQRLALSVREGIKAYLGGSSWDLPPMSIGRSLVPGAKRPLYHGVWSDAFLLSAMDIVQAEGPLLRVCRGARCATLLVKRKRRIFCSEKCASRERMRRFQADQKKYKAKRRQYYLRGLKRAPPPENRV